MLQKFKKINKTTMCWGIGAVFIRFRFKILAIGNVRKWISCWMFNQKKKLSNNVIETPFESSKFWITKYWLYLTWNWFESVLKKKENPRVERSEEIRLRKHFKVYSIFYFRQCIPFLCDSILAYTKLCMTKQKKIRILRNEQRPTQQTKSMNLYDNVRLCSFLLMCFTVCTMLLAFTFR